MDYTKKQQCILCNNGGELLVCADNGCPIHVHENCMGCKPYMDNMENFICPYCIYRRLSNEVLEHEKNVKVAKKQLSIFLDQETSKDKSSLENENNHVSDDDEVQSQSEETNKSGEKTGNNNDINSCRIMVVYIPNTNLDDASVLHKGGKKKGVQLESDVSKKQRLDKDKQTENEKIQIDKSADDDHTDTSDISKKPEGAKKDSSDRGTLIPLRKGGRVLWTEEEVNKLKEGVEKYSQTARKNLPWKKILEYGHDVFNPSRTPSDLKDKWRNITK